MQFDMANPHGIGSQIFAKHESMKSVGSAAEEKSKGASAWDLKEYLKKGK